MPSASVELNRVPEIILSDSDSDDEPIVITAKQIELIDSEDDSDIEIVEKPKPKPPAPAPASPPPLRVSPKLGPVLAPIPRSPSPLPESPGFNSNLENQNVQELPPVEPEGTSEEPERADVSMDIDLPVAKEDLEMEEIEKSSEQGLPIAPDVEEEYEEQLEVDGEEDREVEKHLMSYSSAANGNSSRMEEPVEMDEMFRATNLEEREEASGEEEFDEEIIRERREAKGKGRESNVFKSKSCYQCYIGHRNCDREVICSSCIGNSQRSGEKLECTYYSEEYGAYRSRVEVGGTGLASPSRNSRSSSIDGEDIDGEDMNGNFTAQSDEEQYEERRRDDIILERFEAGNSLENGDLNTLSRGSSTSGTGKGRKRPPQVTLRKDGSSDEEVIKHAPIIKARSRKKKGFLKKKKTVEEINGFATTRVELELPPFVFDQAALDEYLTYQKLLSTAPHDHHQSIAGQSWPGEFDTSLHEQVARLKRRNPIPVPNDTVVFQGMIDFANTYHPKVTLVPPPNGQPPYAPPMEFFYANRVVYPDTAPLPQEAAGCNCEGGCSNAADSTCACRAKQTRANVWYETGVGKWERAERSNHVGFSYRNGVIIRECLEKDEIIYECNASCGCDETCMNRVVGKGCVVPISIYWAGEGVGWGVKVTEETEVPLGAGTVYPAGTPLGVYAGDMILDSQVDFRNIQVYNKIGRAYIFDMDHYRLKRDEPVNGTHPLDAARPFKIEETSIDGFSLGNFTRFLNHSCGGANVRIRLIHVDDHDVSKPLYVFVATKTIKPGDVLNISYFDSHEISEPEDLAAYKKEANATRRNTDPAHRCYCGHELCRGITFSLAGFDEDESDA